MDARRGREGATSREDQRRQKKGTWRETTSAELLVDAEKVDFGHVHSVLAGTNIDGYGRDERKELAVAGVHDGDSPVRSPARGAERPLEERGRVIEPGREGEAGGEARGRMGERRPHGARGSAQYLNILSSSST